jgi:EmrB/QacA subfamily drug resistance transporter
MSVLSDAPAGITHADGRSVHKGLALVVVAIAQLMVVLDATIVNVALPDIAKALKVTSNSDLSWIVTSYTLTFGGFLLLGGKIADRIGRRNVFMAGAVLFAAASLLGGVSGNLGLLIAARAIQGMGGALMSPAALSLLTVVFKEGEERDRALGIWAAITAGGAALGLILGGVLTEYASWRWVFLVNLPIAAIAVVGAIKFVPESRDERAQGFDIRGAVLITGGLMALVYALVKGNDYGWGDVKTLAWFAGALLSLAAFAVVQATSKNPLVPLRVLRNRSALGADIGALLIGAGIFAIFFFLILWMQSVNGWSPIRSGLAFLPMTLLIGVGAGIGSKLLGKIGPRPLLIVGPIVAASGLLQLGLRLEPGSSYVGVVLPALVCVASGMGLTFVALTSSAVAGVPGEDAGIASALLNAGQQVGGAIGLAVLTAVSTSHTRSVFPGFSQASGQVQQAVQTGQVTAQTQALLAKVYDALVSGWGVGFLFGATFLLGAAAIAGSLVKVSKEAAAKALKDSGAAG